jgi:hypothetical protein
VLARFAPAIHSVREAIHADLHPTAPKVQDISPLLEQLHRGRELYDLMMLQVRMDLANKDQDLAARDLLASIALGRNISREPVIVSNLVGIAIETGSMHQLAALLPSLTPEQRAVVRKEYAKLPEPTKFADVIHGEQTLAAQMLPRQMGAKAPEEIKKLAPFYDAVAKASEESPGKFAQTVQKEAENSPSMLAKAMAPALIRPYDAYIRLKIERAMFDAAMDVLDQGPESIQKTSDPAGEGPFKYQKRANGFELSSELRDADNKPVTLVVGK